MYAPSITPLREWRIRPQDQLVVPARFDVHEVDAFDSQVAEILASVPTTVVVDASQVKHLDQSGLDALVATRAAIESENVRFDIVASTTLRVAVELTGSPLLAASSQARVAA